MTGNLRSTMILTTKQIADLLSKATVFELYAEHNQVYHGTLGSERISDMTNDLYVTLYGTEYRIASGSATYKADVYANNVMSVNLNNSELIIA